MRILGSNPNQNRGPWNENTKKPKKLQRQIKPELQLYDKGHLFGINDYKTVKTAWKI